VTRMLVVALICAALYGLWQRSEARAARAEARHTAELLDEAQQRVEAAREAWIVAQAHANRLARERAEAIAAEDAITSEEGANAPASDFLRRAVDAAGGLR
jgi:hypothetical protein